VNVLPIPTDNPLDVDGLTADEDVAWVFSSAKGNAITVSDVDGPAELLTTVVNVTDGTFSLRTDIALNTISGLTSASGNGTNTVTLTGTADAINTALNGASFLGLADRYTHDSVGNSLVAIGVNPAQLSVTTSDANSSSPTDTVDLQIRAVTDIKAEILQTSAGTPTQPFVLTTFEDPTAVITKINGLEFDANGTVIAQQIVNGTAVTVGTFTLTANGLVFDPIAGFESPIVNGFLQPTLFTYEVAAGNSPPESTVLGVQVSAAAAQPAAAPNQAISATSALAEVGNPDVLTGGTGSDVFAWSLADRGTPGLPHEFTVNNFDTTPFSAGGDRLDLRDLLSGETTVTLGNFLDFAKDGADTVISIASTGTGAADTTLRLTGVDLLAATLDLAPGEAEAKIITDLVAQGKLLADNMV
jgi:hypothetical protein